MMRARGPVGWTCPKIDAVIKQINYAMTSGDPDCLEDCERILEEIRSHNDELRSWGADQEDLVSERDDEINDLQRKVSDLEDQIEELKQENSVLELTLRCE